MLKVKHRKRNRSTGICTLFQGALDRDVWLTSFEIDLLIFPDEFFPHQPLSSCTGGWATVRGYKVAVDWLAQ